MTVVDARFAGGPIRVGRELLPHDPDGDSMVSIELPGNQASLFNHEVYELVLALASHIDVGAVNLLVGMLEHHLTQRDAGSRTIRRSSDTDAQLRNLDE